jgi:hypothetical protein
MTHTQTFTEIVFCYGLILMKHNLYWRCFSTHIYISTHITWRQGMKMFIGVTSFFFAYCCRNTITYTSLSSRLFIVSIWLQKIYFHSKCALCIGMLIVCDIFIAIKLISLLCAPHTFHSLSLSLAWLKFFIRFWETFLKENFWPLAVNYQFHFEM